MDVNNLNPSKIFEGWPSTPVYLHNAIGRPDAIVYADDSDMVHVLYRDPYDTYDTILDIKSFLAGIKDDVDAGRPPRAIKERLAYPWEWVLEAEAAGCKDFLYDASWRASNARILTPPNGSLVGWVMEESARAGELIRLMSRKGVDRVTDLWKADDK